MRRGLVLGTLTTTALAAFIAAWRRSGDEPVPARPAARAHPAERAEEPGPTATRPRAIVREMIARLARDGTPAQRKAAFDAIRREGAAAVPALLELLDDPSSRLAALNALEGLRAQDRSSWAAEATACMVEAAQAALETGTPEHRQAALSVLYSLGDESPRATALVVAALRDPDLRPHALAYAASRSPRSLLDVALDAREDTAFRLRAATACFDGAPECRESLRAAWGGVSANLLDDLTAPAPERAAAVELAARLQGAGAPETLSRILRRDGDDVVRCAALKALADTRGLDDARPALHAVAAEPRPSAARAAALRLLRVARR